MENTDNKTMNPVVAGVAGAVIGAGAAVAATKILSDKETRKKIMDTAFNVRSKIADSVNKMGEKIQEGRAVAEQRIRMPRNIRSKARKGTKAIKGAVSAGMNK